MSEELEELRYPIGRWRAPEEPSVEACGEWIEAIAVLPEELEAAVDGLDDEQLDTPYRPGGWTVRQLVHHVADSHLNSYMRFRLAMTEEDPVIRPYDEGAWAELPDAREAPIAVSLGLLRALHERWVRLARTFSEQDLRRTFRHPEHGRALRIDETLSMYAWHGRHHVAHAARLRARRGW